MTATAGFDVYGGVRTSTGSLGTFRYTGEQFDPESGLTFLRATSLDTATGRFLSIDTVQPNAPGTQGWNLYGYVAANPSTWTDPSGHSAAVQYGSSYQPSQVSKGGLAVIGANIAATFMILACVFDDTCWRIWRTVETAARGAGGAVIDRWKDGPVTVEPPTPPWPGPEPGGESETNPGGRTGPKPRPGDDPGLDPR